MVIRSIKIKGFGKLKDLSLEFGPGFNLILGPNESGKTSLQWFIRGMLFGLKGGRAGKDGRLPPAKRFKPWNGHEYGGSLEYTLDSGELFRVERDFSTGSVKVYDGFYNDISGEFVLSREKGLLFAEKHLGISDGIFEKTVLVRQTESRIDSDGAKEIGSRLSNMAQTGFEDVSFQRARQALLDALKTNVGTDRTSVRPYDRVLKRLDELKEYQGQLVKKWERRGEIARLLEEEKKLLKGLEERKSFLVGLNRYFQARNRAAELAEKEKGINKMLITLDGFMEELKTALEEEKRLKDTLSELKDFSAVKTEDIEALYSAHGNLKAVLNEIKRLEPEIERVSGEWKEISAQAGDSLGTEVSLAEAEEKVIGIEAQLERLKEEQEKALAVDRKAAQLKGKGKRLIALAAVLTAAAVFLLAWGLAGRVYSFLLSLPALAASSVLFWWSRRANARLLSLYRAQGLKPGSGKAIPGEMERLRKELKETLDSIGVTSVGELHRKTAETRARARHAGYLGTVLSRLEDQRTACLKEYSALEKELREAIHKLAGADANPSLPDDDFITGIRRSFEEFRESSLALERIEARVKSATDGVEGCLKGLEALTGTPFRSREDVLEALERISGERQAAEKELLELKAGYEGEKGPGHKGLETAACGEDEACDIEDVAAADIEGIIEEAEEGIKEAELRIKEYETLLREAEDVEESLLAVEEEIRRLMERKKELEDTEFSLKTALEVMEEAFDELQRGFLPRFNSHMSRLIERITGGRYQDVRADADMRISLISPETGNVAPVDSLSFGTIEQVYLAFRIAAAQALSSANETLPFIFDEVFAHYDDSRLASALALLGQMAEERQILVFTCRNRELEAAKEVCGEDINVIELY